MINLELLNKLDKEIDKLLENETTDSLTQWLLNKRVGNLHELLGKGKFVNMPTKSKSISQKMSKAVYSSSNKYSGNNPKNRRAA